MPSQPFYDYDGSFFRGMKSDTDPAQLPLGYYWCGENVINVGGMPGCRPGYRCVTELPDGKLQGGTLFRPQFGVEQIVVCISGVLYVSGWPFLSFKQIPGVLMSPSAKQVFWCQTVQSARRKTTDFASAIEVIDPRNVLIIQDGGETAPAYYDGSQSGHIRDNAFETPVGGPMAWVGDRLWVAHRNFVRASDPANPFSFREDTYLGGISAFAFKSEVTGLAVTPSSDTPNLIVFTQNEAELIKAYIRDRDSWPTTTNMQAEAFKIGTPSHKSIVSHYGRLSWFSSAGGVVMLDAAQASMITSRLPIRDNEMMVSKARLGEDLTTVAGAAFGSYMLMSVPAEDTFNKHTWVLNNASLETINDDSGPSWASYWTGTRPVEWVYGNIVGQDRIFHVSTDKDDKNRLWEAFRPDRLDNGCPITWFVETRGYFGQSSQTKPPGEMCKFGWAEVALVGIEEDLDLGVFYAGGLRGAYKNILAKRFNVERGNLVPEHEITAETEIFAFKPQTRVARTEEARQKSDESGSCPVESSNNEDIDESFQLLIVGHGPAAIRWIRAFSTHEQVDTNGSNEACQNETGYNGVRFDGAGVKGEDRDGLVTEMEAKEIVIYTANKTVSITQENITSVGVGYGESVVSQDAADRVAERVAQKRAEIELSALLPRILGIGEAL
jgi:hypothetical protein